MADLAALAARILLAWVFLQSGYAALSNIAGTAAYLAGLGLPMPIAAAWGVGLFETVFGLCLVVGAATRPAALLLAAFAVAAAAIGHLGQGSDPAMAFMHRQAFMKDLAISGGLVLLAIHGPGRLAVDAWLVRN